MGLNYSNHNINKHKQRRQEQLIISGCGYTPWTGREFLLPGSSRFATAY